MKNNIKRYKARIVFAQLVSAGVMSFGLLRCSLTLTLHSLQCQRISFSCMKKNTLAAAGILFIGLGLAFLWVSHRRSTRSLWVVANTSPVDMFLTLEVEEDSDSTNY